MVHIDLHVGMDSDGTSAEERVECEEEVRCVGRMAISEGTKDRYARACADFLVDNGLVHTLQS